PAGSPCRADSRWARPARSWPYQRHDERDGGQRQREPESVDAVPAQAQRQEAQGGDNRQRDSGPRIEWRREISGRQRQRGADSKRHRRAEQREGLLEDRMMQRDANAGPVRPSCLQRPPAQRDVTDVVDDQKHRDGDPPGTERDARERQTGEKRQPPRPDEPVAQRPQRTAQGFAQTLDLIGPGPVVLGPRGGADRQTNEVRVRIEGVRPARTPPSRGRASQASTRPTTVTTAARSASRNSPPTCTRTSAFGSPASSSLAAAWTIREFTRRSTLIVTPPSSPVTNPTSAPSPRPRTPADA